MTVLPGSLDYLYHNGILPCVPYEAYEMTPMTASGRAQMAGLGTGLRESVLAPNDNNFSAPNNSDLFLKNEKSLLKTVDEKTVMSKWLKGLLAGGIMLLTLCCLIKSGKKFGKTPVQTSQNTKSNLWEKFKGIFKKK